MDRKDFQRIYSQASRGIDHLSQLVGGSALAPETKKFLKEKLANQIDRRKFAEANLKR